MLGNTELSQGNADPYTLTDVDIMNEPEVPAPDVSEPEMVSPVETKEEIITQTEEETVTVPKKEPKREIPKKEKPKKETPKKDVPKKETVKPKEKTEAEKRAEAEKAEAEKKAAAERAAAEAAAKKIAGAFGKGTQMGNKGTGTTGFGLEGSPTGNSSEGKSSGVGGYGTFDLNGRSLGSGGLPMPVYNVQDYIEECLLSIMNQSYKEIEIVAVNDGSTDDSLLVLEKMQARDSRIIILNKENGGLSDARNYGIKHSTGDYYLFVDSFKHIRQHN